MSILPLAALAVKSAFKVGGMAWARISKSLV